jgi:hypothetical protein
MSDKDQSTETLLKWVTVLKKETEDLEKRYEAHRQDELMRGRSWGGSWWLPEQIVENHKRIKAIKKEMESRQSIWKRLKGNPHD